MNNSTKSGIVSNTNQNSQISHQKFYKSIAKCYVEDGINKFTN